MKLNLTYLFIILLTACTQAPTTPPIGEMEFPNGSVQHVVKADAIQWMPCPPNLPSGCEIAVLEGDPKRNGLFTVRFKMNSEFIMPPHTHPKDERVTVIAGKVSVGFGENALFEEATQFEPNDYYVNSRGAIHTVWADSACILQITGIGPWEANFIEEK